MSSPKFNPVAQAAINRRSMMAALASTVAAGCGGGAALQVGSPPAAPPPAPRPPPPPAWVAALPLWQWYPIPGTRLSSIDPSPRPLGITGPRSKIDAWCGAALKRSGSVYMLGAAGGHADYAGNEVNALDLSAAQPRWVQLRPPTANDRLVTNTQAYLDLRPSSAHTYYATQFIDSLNRLMVFASAGVESTAIPKAPADFPYTGTSRTASFALASGDWDSPDYVARFPGSGDYTSALCVKHPGTGEVYYSRNYSGGWWRWSPASNIWTQLPQTTSRSPWYAGAAIDTRRDRILVVGGYTPRGPALFGLDGKGVPATFGGLGADAATLAGYPGVVYDEANDAYLVLTNSGAAEGAPPSIDLLRVEAGSLEVSRPALTGAKPAARANGIHNSAQYAPELGGIVIANKHDGDVYFMRTSA